MAESFCSIAHLAGDAPSYSMIAGWASALTGTDVTPAEWRIK
jgi:hypothetical protein